MTRIRPGRRNWTGRGSNYACRSW